MKLYLILCDLCNHIKIGVFIDHQEDTLNLALVQYCFEQKEHKVTPRPHANSKQSESYVRTMPSTLKKLKDVTQNLTAKFAVRKYTSDDSLLTASSAGAIPRNRQQAADMRRHRNVTECAIQGKQKDPLFSVILMCKESEGGKTEDAFVRIVSGAPEPMTVLSFNWSLNDLESFCTNQQCTVLSVDPTFNLGDFYVTVTTYCHLLLENSCGNHPVIMCPIFVHKQKKFETYSSFASSLVGLKPSLRGLVAFGTDGKKALSTTFSTVFFNAIHCYCFLHFDGNLESKLREFIIPKHMQVEFLREIFGDPCSAEDGLVDADSDEDFEGIICSLEKIWNDREMIYNNPPQFYEWFINNCTAEVQKMMLKEYRIKAGLGNPPEPFYTNDVESQNKVIKHQMNYRAQELPDFISLMKEIMVDQNKEIEKAAASIGEYRLKSDYQNLAINARTFFQMSEKQCERIVKALFSSPLNDHIEAEQFEETTMSEQFEETAMSEQFEETSMSSASIVSSSGTTNVLYQLQVPLYLADKVWSESTKILSKKIVFACLLVAGIDLSGWSRVLIYTVSLLILWNVVKLVK